jgi:hypothetical protein
MEADLDFRQLKIPAPQRQGYKLNLIDRLRALPGVEGVADASVSQTPAKAGPMVFFNPSAICSVYASQSSGIFNQSRLFHEFLHGFYGEVDETIQKGLGLAQVSDTTNITFYIQPKVFGKPPGVCAN